MESDYIILNNNIEFTDEVISNISKYTKIYVGAGYTGKLDLIPHSIKELNINIHIRRELGKFPIFLEQLTTESTYQDYIDLPLTLKIFINKDTVTQKTINTLKYGLEYIYMNNFSGTNFVLPDSVQTIIFNNKLNGLHSGCKIQYPTSLKKLVLPNGFKQNLDGVLPANLESLKISSGYNNTLNNLPSNLKHLIFDKSDFNQSLDNLPNGLESLIFEDYHLFDKPIDNLPDTIKRLELPSSRFNQKINNFPNGLESMSIHIHKSNINLLDNLPNSIKNLKLIVTREDESICSEILCKIHNLSLIKSLSLDGFTLINCLPKNLTILRVKKSFQYFRKNIITADLNLLQFIELNDIEEIANISNIYPHIIFI